MRALTNDIFNKPKQETGIDENPYRLNEPKTTQGILMNNYGKGWSYQVKNVIDRQIWWDKRSSTLDPFLETIRSHIAPDFGIDFAAEGMRKND